MPIYEFECTACGRQFEELVSLSADLSKIECPGCGKQRARKLLSAFATSTKGDGGGAPASDCAACSIHNCPTRR